MTKPSPYSDSESRPEICTSDRKYLFVYPFDKKREWYGLPLEERQRIMANHIEVGRRYPEISINTAYSFGLDDQEFVVSFEGDDPGEFLDLVQELRGTESSSYTLRDTPIFTCVAMSLGRALDALDGTAATRGGPHSRLGQPLPFPRSALIGSRTEQPLRVAIVGSGPAGFYTAEHILKHEGTHAEVDMFDRLPTPYGLVRFGVAPDHPKIKSVIRVYEKTAARPEFRFFGNVEVGNDVSVDELRERYHAVVFAYGTATDRHLGIPGEDLPGSHPATEFVNWYNAHPDFADREFDLSCERVVVIGNGNVAADVARMLALTADELGETDTADHAIEAFDARRGQGDPRARPPRPRPGRLHQPRGPRAGRDGRRRHRRRRRRDGAGRPQPRVARLRRRRSDQPPQRRDLHRLLPARARGQEQEDRDALPPLPRRDPGRRQGRADRGRPQRAAARRLRAAPRGRHRRARDDRVRPGAALDRLQGHPDRGHPLRRAAAA